MPEPVHVIVHAGFHKTGTSSLQEFLRKTRPRLKDYAAIYLKVDFLDAGNLGRIYGLKPYFWRRRQFRRAFRAFLATIPSDPVIVLSWEGLSGVMPGHRRLLTGTIQDFKGSAVPLGREIVTALRARFGDDTRITYLYTLRERESWIRSVYGHVVRSIRITDDFPTFRQKLPRLPHLADEAKRIVARLPRVTLVTADLETIGKDRLGPASVILDMIGVPDTLRNSLPAAVRANAGLGAATEDAFLELNRTIDDKHSLKRRKEKLRQQG